jgi:hypothetical protein
MDNCLSLLRGVVERPNYRCKILPALTDRGVGTFQILYSHVLGKPEERAVPSWRDVRNSNTRATFFPLWGVIKQHDFRISTLKSQTDMQLENSQTGM